VFLFLKEVVKVDSSSGERSRVEGQHCEMRSLFRKKLVGLVASVR